MPKVILVLCDALRNDTATAQMGYLEGQVAARRATRWVCEAALPTLSRPLYETIHTGTPPATHGILSNLDARRSEMANVFSMVRAAGKVTAASAYNWYAELYIKAPFDRIMDREIDDDTVDIQHGRFYSDENASDIEVFTAGAMLMARYFPDYLLIHPMGLDTVGHKHGGTSAEYNNQAVLQDGIMAVLLPRALALGYTVLVTGDHGMNAAKTHNGTLPDVRHVPLYYLPPDGMGEGDTEAQVSQLQLAPTILKLLAIPPAPTMTAPPLPINYAAALGTQDPA